MANYDGEITLSVDLDTKQVTQSANKLAKSLQDLFTSQGAHQQTKEFQSWQAQVDKVVSKARDLSNTLDTLATQQIPTEQYTEIQKQVEKAEQALLRLYNKREEYEELGKQAPDRLALQIENAEQNLERLESGMQQLVDSGKAFTLGSDTEEFQKVTEQLNQVNNQMVVLEARGAKMAETPAKKLDSKLVPALKRVKTATQQVIKEQTKGLPKIELNWGKLVKKVLAYGFGIRSLYVLFRRLRGAIAEGINNLAQWNDGNNAVNDALSQMTSSILYLKNALAAMVAPIIQTVMPVLVKFVDILAEAANKAAMFFAALAGQKTVLQAVKVMKQYGEATKKANKESQGTLQTYDKLNNVSSKKDTDTDTGVSPNDMFKKVPVDENVKKWLDDVKQKFKDLLAGIQPFIDRVKELADLFTQGFTGTWDFLNIGDQIDDILQTLSKIGQHIKDIFTDPNVVEAFNRMLDKWAYAAGQIAASLISIFLTMVQNILGGIEKYLAENKDRIKKFLIEEFNIWGDIAAQLGEFFVAFANIFQAFASNEGKQLTANLIGIFADAFMGIRLLIDKFNRDVLILLTQPIIDNQEKIKAALTDYLGFLADITGTIKDFVDETVDNLNKMYDDHIKPLFESLTEGVSEIVSKLLDFWDAYVKPMLDDMAAKWDTLWKENLQPMVNQAIVLIGQVADALKAIWENVIQPFIEWLIANVLPVVIPILQNIYTTVFNIFGDIAQIIQGAIKVIGGIIDFLIGVFTGDWERAWGGLRDILDGVLMQMQGLWEIFWDFFSGLINGAITTVTAGFKILVAIFEGALTWVGELFENIGKTIQDAMEWIAENGVKQPINAIIGFFENMANAVVEAINAVISAINKLSFDVPDWVPELGGKKFGFNIPKVPEVSLPRLAQGAVIPPNNPFMAMLGDQTSGTNIEAPLDTIQQALYGALVQAGLTGGGKKEDIVVQIDGREIARAVRKEDNIFRKSTGASMFSY